MTLGLSKNMKRGDHALYSSEIATEFLSRAGVEMKTVEAVAYCIQTHRFSGETPGNSRSQDPAGCRQA